jgi:hypothetical protein
LIGVLVRVDRIDALAIDDLGAAREHGIEHAALGVEVVMQQGSVDFRVLRHFANRHAPEAVTRKMIFGGIEDALAHVGRAVVLQRAAAPCPALAGLGTLNGHVGVLVALHSIHWTMNI